MITFEYILIAGVNDGLDQVKPLGALARRLNAKVNLIPYNQVEGLPWQRPGVAVTRAQRAAACRLLRATGWRGARIAGRGTVGRPRASPTASGSAATPA